MELRLFFEEVYFVHEATKFLLIVRAICVHTQVQHGNVIGPFFSIGSSGNNIVRCSFGARFPFQVRVRFNSNELRSLPIRSTALRHVNSRSSRWVNPEMVTSVTRKFSQGESLKNLL